MPLDELNPKAPELRVNDWIDAAGETMDRPLRLVDLGPGYKIVYCFQHWCPGCHSYGFPTLRYLQDNLAGKGVGFAVIQTVFEGAETNTFDKLRIDQLKYGLKIPFGHDLPPEGGRQPTFMEDYQTGGTPWFTVIDSKGEVVFSDFRLDADSFLKAVGIEPTIPRTRDFL